MPDSGPGATPAEGATPSTTDDATKPTTGAATTPEGEGDGDEATLAEAGRKAIQRERDQRKASDERARVAEERLKAIEEKDLPAAEKAGRRLAELEEENKRLAGELVLRDVQSEVFKAAGKIGVVDVEVAMLLLTDGDLIDFDKDGKPTNVEAAIKDLVKAKPWLAKPVGTGADAGAGTRPGGSPGQSVNDLLRRAAGRGQ